MIPLSPSFHILVLPLLPDCQPPPSISCTRPSKPNASLFPHASSVSSLWGLVDSVFCHGSIWSLNQGPSQTSAPQEACLGSLLIMPSEIHQPSPSRSNFSATAAPLYPSLLSVVMFMQNWLMCCSLPQDSFSC